MPLFMAVSGFLFAKSLKLRFWELIKKKAFTLLWPALLWSVPKMIMTKGSVFDVIIYNVWFLKSLFLCYLIFYVLYQLMNERLIIILIVVVSIFIPLEIFPGYLNMMLPSFAFGILLNKNRGIISKKNKFTDLVLFLSYLLLFIMCPTDQTPHGAIESFAPFSVSSVLITQYIYRMVMAFLAVLLSFRLFSKYNNSNVTVSFIGQSTLCIYLMNGLFSDILMHTPLPLMRNLMVYFCVGSVTLLQFVVYYYVIKFVDNHQLLNLILFARK